MSTEAWGGRGEIDGGELVKKLSAVVGHGAVVSEAEELIVYECDGFTIPRAAPLAVVFPASTQQVAGVVNVLREMGAAIMARGSGTGLTGGTAAVVPGVQVSLARMNRVLEIDLRNRWALVEAGVTNFGLSEAVGESIYHFAPDPSSLRASTIGGNVATNAGGLHTLKYGVTVNHILGVEVVLEDGSVQRVGGPGGWGARAGGILGRMWRRFFAGLRGRWGLSPRRGAG